MKTLKHIFTLLLSCTILASCVYEYPVETPGGSQLNLTFVLDTSITDEYARLSDLNKDDYDVRYVIKAYRKLSNGAYGKVPHKTFVFAKDEIADLDSTVVIELDEGDYKFYSFADYVPQYSEEDFHYNTSDFSYVGIRCKDYHGNTDTKAIYSGSHEIFVERYGINPVICDTIKHMPVLAKYYIVATDLQEFIQRTGKADLEGYKVVIKYTEDDLFFTHIDIYNDNNPCDGVLGMSYDSGIVQMNDTSAILGFDHIIAKKDAKKPVRVNVSIYKKDGTHITTVPVSLPVKPGRTTYVKGKFLTYVGLEDPKGNGVAINPDFDGDFDIYM